MPLPPSKSFTSHGRKKGSHSEDTAAVPTMCLWFRCRHLVLPGHRPQMLRLRPNWLLQSQSSEVERAWAAAKDSISIAVVETFRRQYGGSNALNASLPPRAEREWLLTIALSTFNSFATACAAFLLGIAIRWFWS